MPSAQNQIGNPHSKRDMSAIADVKKLIPKNFDKYISGDDLGVNITKQISFDLMMEFGHKKRKFKIAIGPSEAVRQAQEEARRAKLLQLQQMSSASSSSSSVAGHPLPSAASSSKGTAYDMHGMHGMVDEYGPPVASTNPESLPSSTTMPVASTIPSMTLAGSKYTDKITKTLSSRDREMKDRDRKRDKAQAEYTQSRRGGLLDKSMDQTSAAEQTPSVPKTTEAPAEPKSDLIPKCAGAYTPSGMTSAAPAYAPIQREPVPERVGVAVRKKSCCSKDASAVETPNQPERYSPKRIEQTYSPKPAPKEITPDVEPAVVEPSPPRQATPVEQVQHSVSEAESELSEKLRQSMFSRSPKKSGRKRIVSPSPRTSPEKKVEEKMGEVEPTPKVEAKSDGKSS